MLTGGFGVGEKLLGNMQNICFFVSFSVDFDFIG